jgi:hypothetical protein
VRTDVSKHDFRDEPDVFLCMLAYHVEDHIRAALAPDVHDKTDHEACAAMRASIVAKAERSDAAKRKQTTGRTTTACLVHADQSRLVDLATYCRIQANAALDEKYVLTSTPGQPRSTAAPSNTLPSTRIVPGRQPIAFDSREKDQWLVILKEGPSS